MWSTRELADLAGTTLRTVRHYHDIGLLPEPERGLNGYKQYDITHLTRLLRIRRLTELGMSLSEIGDLAEDDEHPVQSLQRLHDELSADITRLQRMQTEIADILTHRLPVELPVEFAGAKPSMSTADRSLLVLWGRVLPPHRRVALQQVIAGWDDPEADAAFEALPADADEDTRAALADRMAPLLRAARAAHPDGFLTPDELSEHSPAGRHIAATMAQLFNPAQRDVLARMGRTVQADAPS